MHYHNILLALATAVALPASAETVLLFEDFDTDYTKTFAYMYDADGQQPHSSIASIFYSSATGYYMPWWLARDSNASPDRFMASHSFYETPGTSNDWLISVPIEIPTTGFVLTLDAQSVPVRSLDKLSDLALFVTDKIIDETNVPETPTHVWTAVPYGADPDNCEGDWTHLSYPLDDYAGRTVYINLVNKNTDNDIICVDNVKVARADAAEFVLEAYDAYTADPEIDITATVTVTDPAGLANWQVTATCGDLTIGQWQGDTMAEGASRSFTATATPEACQTADIVFTLTSEGCQSLSRTATVTRMTFMPTHRVFIEETTSLYCGNCPMGLYTIESMMADPDFADNFLPVSVHVMALGYDPMATSAYYNKLPDASAAPIVWVDRQSAYDGFIPAYDCNYDPTNPSSFAARIAARIASPTFIDVTVEATPVTVGSDTTAVACTARVIPALNLSDCDYRVAFILTENNVGLDANPYWHQENYLSGNKYDNPWCRLPDVVFNARYHEVARAISAYNGHPVSLPATMDANSEYSYTGRIDIPDTYAVSEAMNIEMSPAVCPSRCEITAIVIDNNTGLVVNGARVALSPLAHERFTADDLVAAGIDGITVDSVDDDQAIYYDLTGRRIAAPSMDAPGWNAAGIYIKVTATGAHKVINKR